MMLFYFYGDNARYFDYIYIAALCLSCLFCWNDKDTLGALLILLGYWLAAKALINGPNQWQYWLLVYGISISVCLYYFHHITAKITLIMVFYSTAAEWLWWIEEYASKPRVYYYVGLLALTLWVRQLLFNRIFIAHEYFNYTSGKTGLDTHARGILYFSFVLILLMTIEYFARHLGGLSDITTIYYLYTPMSNIISGVTLAIIYMHYFNNQSKKYLSA